jgi:predicted alternative tryptophan synthase beta-subunit
MNELLEAANQRMQLQNRLDQLLGNNQAILARQREAELSAMHELNRPLAQMIYNLEDAQFALAQAEQAVGQAFAALSCGTKCFHRS